MTKMPSKSSGELFGVLVVVVLLVVSFSIIMVSCGTTTPPPVQWKAAPQTFHVDIVINKYDRDTCVNAGGTWIIGDSKDWANVLVGCIEPTKSEVK